MVRWRNKTNKTNKTNMKTNPFAIVAAALLALVGSTGCMSTNRTMIPGGIYASNKPVEQGKYTVLNGGNTVTGSYTTNMMKSDKNIAGSAMKKAVDTALAQCDGADALVGITTDTVVENKLLWILYVPVPWEMNYITFVTGTPVKTKE